MKDEQLSSRFPTIHSETFYLKKIHKENEKKRKTKQNKQRQKKATLCSKCQLSWTDGDWKTLRPFVSSGWQKHIQIQRLEFSMTWVQKKEKNKMNANL